MDSKWSSGRDLAAMKVPRGIILVVVVVIYSAVYVAVKYSTIEKLSHEKAKIDGTEGRLTSDDDTPSTLSLHSTKLPSSAENASSTAAPGMHLCTCLTDTDTSLADLPPIPKRIRWLHFPKTGTSFISTLWSYTCSTRERYIDLEISSDQCDIFTRNGFSMYDFALMKRYPWEIYGAPNMINPDTIALGKDIPLGLVGGTQHMALTPSISNTQSSLPARYKQLKELTHRINVWGSEWDHNLTIAAFFRQPEERIVSAYYDSRHANGFTLKLWQELRIASSGRPCQILNQTYKNPLECFTRFPGIAGCMTRMLTGELCADAIFQGSGLENVAEAVDLVLTKLQFVGLTEDWNESICQFHRMFAGNIDKNTGRRVWSPPLQGEFANVHTSGSLKKWGVKDLNGFKDVADDVVYAAAKSKFEQIVGDTKCYKYISWEDLNSEMMNKSRNYFAESMPYIMTDSDGNLCLPKTCTDLGKQCGEYPDGCGSTVICGLCNPGRTGLPSTWRVKCVEGKCMDYCPPWDHKGYWFKADIMKSKSPNFLKEITSIFEEGQAYLTPLNAVSICQLACAAKNNETGNGTFVATELCYCDNTPTKFLLNNFSFKDFSVAHDLKTNCMTSEVRRGTFLMKNETQPLCCPDLDLTRQQPKNWKRLNVMSLVASKKDNIEGEYFDYIPLECGAFAECEMVARQKSAELAVFDVYNRLCYLARNVVELKDAYTVTKDNAQRYYIDLRT